MLGKYIAALALSALSLQASAAQNIIVDFSGVGDGAFVNEYYNGGTDSLGNKGPNYGLSFLGTKVNYHEGNAYASSLGTVLWEPRQDLTWIYFDAVSKVDLDGSPVYLTSPDGMQWIDSQWVGPRPAWYDRDPVTGYWGFKYGSVFDAVWTYRMLGDFDDKLVGGLYSSSMGYFDNLTFDSPSWWKDTRGSDTAPGRVPEPGTMALLGLGVASLLAGRRKRA